MADFGAEFYTEIGNFRPNFHYGFEEKIVNNVELKFQRSKLLKISHNP